MSFFSLYNRNYWSADQNLFGSDILIRRLKAMFVVTLYCAGKTSREIKASTGLGFPVDFLCKNYAKICWHFESKLHKISMLLHIDVQKLFCANSEENLGICIFFISCYFVILLNFEKQFQEMMNEFKIKPIRATDQARQLYSSPLNWCTYLQAKWAAILRF